MIPYMIGKLAPNSSHLTKGLVKHVSDRGYFRTVPSKTGDKNATSPPPPNRERVISLSGDCVGGSHTHKNRLVMVAARWHESHASPTTTVRAYIIISDVKVTIFHRVAVTCTG